MSLVLACNSQCATCTGPSSLQCTSCSNSSAVLFNSSCISTCPSHYYSASGTCTLCYSTCSSCSGGSSQQCTSCYSGSSRPYLDSDSCVSNCASGEFLNGTVCAPCDSSCLICSGPLSSQCQRCVNSSDYIFDGTCSAACPAIGAYILSAAQMTCGSCDSSCLSCNGGSSSSCLTCPANGVLYLGSCLSQCPTSTSLDNSTNSCQPCDSDCTSCVGPANTDCLTCSSLKRVVNVTDLIDSSGPCVCANGSFEFPVGTLGYSSRDCWGELCLLLNLLTLYRYLRMPFILAQPVFPRVPSPGAPTMIRHFASSATRATF